jgi:hypothetical protein
MFPDLRKAEQQARHQAEAQEKQRQVKAAQAKKNTAAAKKAVEIRAKGLAQEDKAFLSVVPAMKTGADAEHVKESYEAHWGKRIAGVRNKFEAGETLAHVLASMRPPVHRAKGANRVSSAPATAYLPDRGLDMDAEGIPNIRLAVAGGRYTAVSNFDPLRAVELLSRKVTHVVELGAGPGWNLFDLSIQMGVSVHSKNLWGLEYTDAGVGLMQLIAEHEGLPLSGHHFNYLSPDISMIPDDASALIFSHHSIEQVETISSELFQQILARKKPTFLVHCEPIGWQRFPELLKAREDGNEHTWKALSRRRTDDVASERTQALNAALNSWRLGYNRNALGLIDSFAASPRVQTIRRIYDFTHRNNVNPVNPSTYIEMRLN